MELAHCRHLLYVYAHLEMVLAAYLLFFGYEAS